jgi:hypothetical protein
MLAFKMSPPSAWSSEFTFCFTGGLRARRQSTTKSEFQVFWMTIPPRANGRSYVAGGQRKIRKSEGLTASPYFTSHPRGVFFIFYFLFFIFSFCCQSISVLLLPIISPERKMSMTSISAERMRRQPAKEDSRK